MSEIIQLPAPKLVSKARVGGVFQCSIIRDGKVIDKWEDHNIVVNQGLNLLLNNALAGVAAQTSWYIGIFSGNYTPALTDTGATIASNSTESAAYTSTTRPAWTPPSGGTSNQTISNSASPASFTMNASVTIYGAFLVSSNVINGTAGDLMAASQFSAARALLSGDVLNVTYALSATG